MARIRTIKPGFFRHADLYDAEVKHKLPLRIAFAGLWTAADREGRFAWKPRSLKLDCLPFDDVDFGEVLDALAAEGFLIKYKVGADTFGCIPSWSKHQQVNIREAKSEIPAHDGTSASTCTHMPTPVQDRGEGKGREQEGKGTVVAAQARPAPKATRWKSEDEIPADWLAEANQIRAKANLSPVDPALEAARFVDFWAAKSGKDATKADWHATWRNWIRNSRGGAAPNGTGRQPMGPA